MPRVKAIASHDFDEIRRNPGDEYEAHTEDMADTLEKLEWAERVKNRQRQRSNPATSHTQPKSLTAAAPTPAADVESQRARTYRRRDMQAES